MRRPRVPALYAVLVMALAAPSARAQVSAEEAARLGGPELTPLGAERAGNREGTIPPWTGGLTEPPADYSPGARHPDPFSADPIRLTITAANLEEHARHLSPGQQALLRAYPDTWRLNVYPTRRSASYPDWVYEAVRANATAAELVVEGRGAVRNSRISSPFPIPRSGVEVVWNHNLRWRGVRVNRSNGVAAVTRRGRYRLVLNLEDFAFPYGDPDVGRYQRVHPNIMLALKRKTIAPALLTGDGLLVVEPLDQTRDPRKAWLYSRNLRRVFRSPFSGYDDPAPGTAGLRTIDDFQLFNGPPDRFEWELLGKQALYIPYNAYRIDSGEVGPGDILERNHIDPDLARYELHRVWVVQGTLRPGQRHVYSRRIFYVDEDSWQIAVTDSYDRDGALWRVAETHALNFYEVPVVWEALAVFQDLQERRYLVDGLDNGRNPYRFSEELDPREFSPNALAFYIR